MMRNTKIRAMGLTAVALMLSSSVALGSNTAGANVNTPFVRSQDAGHLALQIRNNVVTVTRFSPTNVALTSYVYPIQGRCNVESTAAAAPLRFSTSGGVAGGLVGVDSNGLGSKPPGTGGCTRADGRIEAPESITVALNMTLLALANTKIDAVELDLEGKGDASYVITTNGPTGSTSGVPVTLGNRSDTGPDSGAGDNNKVVFGSETTNAEDFTSITIAASAGQIGLDGGGDGVYPAANMNSKGTFASIFHLVTSETFEYSVGCGDQVTASQTLDGLNSTDTAGLDSLVSGVRYLRLPNKNQTACPVLTADASTKIGVEIQASQYDATTKLDDVFVNNSSTSADGTAQNVRARVRIDWVVETAGKSQAAVAAELDREIDLNPFDLPAGTGTLPVVYCTSVPAQVASNPMPEKAQWEANAALLAPIVHPANTPWCLLSETQTLSGTTITQVQIYSGNGDPQFK